MDLHGRNLLKELDLTSYEFLSLVSLARNLRADRRRGRERPRLEGLNIALVFEKASTRTRSAFELAAHHQGAHVTYLGPEESPFGHKESARDSARVLGRLFDGIGYRGFSQEVVETLGRSAGVPVWNALTDRWHPTQTVADILTIHDHLDRPLEEIALCYVGDARNNMANSLLVTGALLGMDIRVCGPGDLLPTAPVRAAADELAVGSGAAVTVGPDLQPALEGADFVYTDVWLSMGEPAEAWGDRIQRLLPYQVNADLLAATGNPDVRFMHCLPALHDADTEVGRTLRDTFGLTGGVEVTDEVFESPASIVFDQAENRLHAMKAIMVATLGG